MGAYKIEGKKPGQGCPVLSGMGVSLGADQNFPNVNYAGIDDFCGTQRACAALQEAPNDVVRHLDVAKVIMEHPCHYGHDQNGPCNWSCIGGRDLQFAINHTRIAYNLASSLPKTERELLMPRIKEYAERQGKLLPQNKGAGYGKSKRWPHAFGQSPGQGDQPRTNIDVLTASNAELMAHTPYHKLLVDDDEVGAMPISRIAEVSPVQRVSMASGGQVALYRMKDFLPGFFARDGMDLNKFNQRLATRVVSALERCLARHPKMMAKNPTTQNLEFFNWQDGLFAFHPHEKSCKWGTALPELQQLEEYRALVNALIRAASNFEVLYSTRGNGSESNAHPLVTPPCSTGPAEGDQHLGSRGFKDFAVSASSKKDNAGHGTHVHVGASATGVYYAQIPEGSGHILIDDSIETLQFRPEPGDLILFPGWLSHGALANKFDDHQNSTRVSFSFDMRGNWWHVPESSDVPILTDSPAHEVPAPVPATQKQGWFSNTWL